MCVQKIYADGQLLDGKDLQLPNGPQRLLLKIAILASDATSVDGADIGDPTEVALVQLGDLFGVEEVAYRQQHPRLGEIAFDSDRKLMSTLHDIDGTPTLLTKGAIDVMLGRATKIFHTAKGFCPWMKRASRKFCASTMRLSEQGLRVLAFGYRPVGCGAPPSPWRTRPI